MKKWLCKIEALTWRHITVEAENRKQAMQNLKDDKGVIETMPPEFEEKSLRVIREIKEAKSST